MEWKKLSNISKFTPLKDVFQITFFKKKYKQPDEILIYPAVYLLKLQWIW